MDKAKAFKWRPYEGEIILLRVRWYLRYSLSYRELEEMMIERGLNIDHTTIYRWVLAYASELDRRCRPHLKSTYDSYRVDKTYIRIRKEWEYLYRAVDSEGSTIEFMLSPKRDAKAVKRFFRKILKSTTIAVKRRVAPGLGFSSFRTAWKTIRGYETMNMIRKGQIKGVTRKDVGSQVKFIGNLFGLAS